METESPAAPPPPAASKTEATNSEMSVSICWWCTRNRCSKSVGYEARLATSLCRLERKEEIVELQANPDDQLDRGHGMVIKAERARLW